MVNNSILNPSHATFNFNRLFRPKHYIYNQRKINSFRYYRYSYLFSPSLKPSNSLTILDKKNQQNYLKDYFPLSNTMTTFTTPLNVRRTSFKIDPEDDSVFFKHLKHLKQLSYIKEKFPLYR
jgi:hypothetical protein